MGCWNVAATMSHRTIGHGDEVALFLLERGDVKSSVPGGTSWISNRGGSLLFRPCALPIFGEYNDYGSIENVVRDKNVEFLEEKYGMSIEDIVTNIRDSDASGCDLPAVAVMWEQKSIFDQIVAYSRDLNSMYNEATVSKEHFIAFGFEEETFGDRLIYTLPEGSKQENIIVGKDNHDRLKVENVEGAWVYRVVHIAELLEGFGVDTSNIEAVNEFKTTSVYKPAIERVHAKLATQLPREDFDSQSELLKSEYEAGNITKEEFSTGISELLSMVGGLFSDSVYEGVWELKENTSLQYTIDAGLDKELDDYLLWNSIFAQMNAHYAPTTTGAQHGDLYIEKAVCKIIAEDIDRKLADYEE